MRAGPCPGLAKLGTAGMENTRGKASGAEFQQHKKCCTGLLLEFLFPKPRPGWPGVPASPHPARPLRGEFNSLPAGSLTLVCSEARNYKDLQEKKKPRRGLTIAHGGLSSSALELSPPSIPLFPAAGSDSHSSPGWAQPENRDRNLLRGCAERVEHPGWNFGMQGGSSAAFVAQTGQRDEAFP